MARKTKAEKAAEVEAEVEAVEAEVEAAPEQVSAYGDANTTVVPREGHGVEDPSVERR